MYSKEPSLLVYCKVQCHLFKCTVQHHVNNNKYIERIFLHVSILYGIIFVNCIVSIIFNSVLYVNNNNYIVYCTALPKLSCE